VALAVGVAVSLLAAASARAATGAAAPLELVWVIRAGPLTPDEPYDGVRAQLARLVALCRAVGARATVLVSGDVAEEALARGHVADYTAAIDAGCEVGTYVAAVERAAPRRWRPVTAGAASRPGRLGTDPLVATRQWADHAGWVDRLVGSARNRAVEAEAFRCSTEAELAARHHLDVSFCRAGLWTLYTGDLAPGPWIAAASDRPGEELAPAGGPGPALMALDRAGQVGDPFDPMGNSSVLHLREAFLRRIPPEMPARPPGAPGRPASIGVLAFLTRAAVATARLYPDASRLVRWLAAAAPRAARRGDVAVRAEWPGGGGSVGGRRARWSTASGVRTAFLAFRAAHPGAPAYAHVHRGPDPEPVAVAIRARHVAAIARLRAERGRSPTTPENFEFRWWALSLWRHALRSTDPEAAARSVPDARWQALVHRLERGADGGTLAQIDRLLGDMEESARRDRRAGP
jgi:hypothetical protein